MKAAVALGLVALLAQPIDDDQWLTSCDDEALAQGANLAVVGSELLQFGQALALGSGRFRLSRLLRGRGGTEWASGTHSLGDLFCLIDATSLQTLSLPAWLRGSLLTVADRDGSNASITFAGECARPLAPVDVAAALNPAGDLSLSWIRRSRTGFIWVDEVDAPIGESRELYSIAISTAVGTIELTCDGPSLVVPASELTPLGGGAATIAVRQLGDWAASRPTQANIDLS